MSGKFYVAETWIVQVAAEKRAIIKIIIINSNSFR